MTAEESCLCDRCTALCCRYIALPIDNPETPEDFDDVRWYLAHERIHVFIEEDQWYISIQSSCEYLLPDHRCGIYEDRPKICRTYSTDNCDFHTGGYEYQQYFSGPEQLEAYAQHQLGSRYARYAAAQRQANTRAAPGPHEGVLTARRRPTVKARRPRGGRPIAEALVRLSIDGRER